MHKQLAHLNWPSTRHCA